MYSQLPSFLLISLLLLQTQTGCEANRRLRCLGPGHSRIDKKDKWRNICDLYEWRCRQINWQKQFWSTLRCFYWRKETFIDISRHSQYKKADRHHEKNNENVVKICVITRPKGQGCKDGGRVKDEVGFLNSFNVILLYFLNLLISYNPAKLSC